MSLKWYGAEIESKLDQAMIAGLEACAVTVEGKAALLCPVNMGRLRGSITHRTVYERSVAKSPAKPSDAVQAIPKKNEAYVGTNVNYASWVEFGRLPGKMPPVDMIAEWVRQKKIASGKELMKAAWAIAMSIKRRGIKPKSFLRKAADDSRGILDSIFTNAFKKVMK